ncbi:MAG: hypothetical protein ACD_72C00105G0003 [uncultured bacterium]|nr:MAG: hypothetical protein ACD_72C00105G0003 [uncultured bacterium]
MKNVFQKFKNDQRGNILMFVMVFGSIAFSMIVIGVAGYAISENGASNYKHNREMAFQIAEAGINYYRWHLAHNNTDYQDGTGVAGPYVHVYEDKDGNAIGHFSLDITAPPNGSTVVLVQSTGWLDSQPNSRRVLKARLGFPALTDYAFLTNGDVWIGDNETISGKFHANGGIRFDGVGNAPITSAVPTYLCKAYHGCGNQTKPGIWGQGTPTTYWNFPVPAQDFSAITANLAAIKVGSQLSGGIYLSSSGKQGWRLQFMSNGTVKASKVNTASCYKAKDVNSNNYFWPCIDAATYGSVTTYNMPTNGYIYVEDNVWVDGTINGRATVGTAIGKNIIINGNLIYSAKDGNHVLGLIAEQNVLIPHNSLDTLEVDAALLAQNGGAKRYYYPGDMKSNLIIYGSVISNGLWTWSWISGGGAVVSGYRVTNATYDANLTYGPPPGFPVGSQYNMISWEEVE